MFQCIILMMQFCSFIVTILNWKIVITLLSKLNSSGQKIILQLPLFPALVSVHILSKTVSPLHWRHYCRMTWSAQYQLQALSVTQCLSWLSVKKIAVRLSPYLLLLHHHLNQHQEQLCSICHQNAHKDMLQMNIILIILIPILYVLFIIVKSIFLHCRR